MRKPQSFNMLWQAVKSTRRALWASIQILLVLTLVIATIFYFAERSEFTEEKGYIDSLLYAFTVYIQDPGELTGLAPVTPIGRWMATLLGVVAILIFAIPAGLIGGGFTSAIEEKERNEHLQKIGDRLRKAFRREQDSKTMYRHVPRFIHLGTLQAKKNMTERDVIDAVEYNPPYRLRNLATAEGRGKHSFDQLAVEMFPYNRDSYGCAVDRGSKITIACPSSVDEAGIGNFGFYLALIGGFNFISKEIEPDIDEPVSFYLVDESKLSSERDEYVKELKSLSVGRDKWTIFLISSERDSEFGLHFITKANAKTGRDSTIIDQPEFEKLYASISEKLGNDFDIKSELDTDYRPAGPKNIAVKIGGGIDTNAFTIRLSSEIAVWDPRYIQICKEMAKAINGIIGDGTTKTNEERLKEPGFGYQLKNF